jgi:hypothetical protein
VIICCLQLNTQWLFGWYPAGGLLVIDAVGLRSMYYVVMPSESYSDPHDMCMHSLFCQLPNCNLFTQHVIYLYGETPLVNCGPRSILLHSYYRLLLQALFTFSQITIFYHDTFNPLFTANRWDWQPHCKLGQSTLIVLCVGSTLLLVQSYALDNAPYINCLELSPSQLASTFGSWLFLLLVR